MFEYTSCFGLFLETWISLLQQMDIELYGSWVYLKHNLRHLFSLMLTPHFINFYHLRSKLHNKTPAQSVNSYKNPWEQAGFAGINKPTFYEQIS